MPELEFEALNINVVEDSLETVAGMATWVSCLLTDKAFIECYPFIESHPYLD